MKSKAKKKKIGFSLEELNRHVKQGAIKPCYLFAGKEQFTAEEGVAMLRDANVPPEQQSFNFDVVYGHDVQPSEIVALASSYPMMGEKRMVVVKEFDNLKNPDGLTAYIKNPLESTVLVLLSESPDFRRNPFRVFDDTATLDCKPVYDNQMPQWIVQRVKRYKKSITADAAAVLPAYTGTSLRQASNELDKLDIYTGKRTEITVEDVHAVVGVTKEFSIFELQRAIGMKDTANAINILDRMLERGESAVFIIAMLTRLFMQISMVADLRERNIPPQKIAQEVKVNLFFLDDYFTYLNHHPPHSIPDRFKAILEADVSLKTTGKDNRLILSILLYRLMDKATEPVESLTAFEEQFSE